jgi:apolipoprotein N-acyltransferase
VREHFKKLCDCAAINKSPAPDLIIWPETSFPDSWFEVSPGVPVEKLNEPAYRRWRDLEIDIRDQLGAVAHQYGVPQLIGINANQLDPAGRWLRYNSALLVRPISRPIGLGGNGIPEGRIEGKFDKVHRIPFGEFIPLYDWFPFLAWLSPYEDDISITPGIKLTRFEVAKHKFGVLICYEDTDPFLARRYVEKSEDGPPVDFLVDISNDGWFDGSSEHEEHLAVARFRAIECRRSVVRAVNMGVSAVIDGNGRVLRPEKFEGPTPPLWMVKHHLGKPDNLDVSDWHKFKMQQLVLMTYVPIDNRTSFYAIAGDWLPIGTWAMLVGATGYALVRRRRFRTMRLAA